MWLQVWHILTASAPGLAPVPSQFKPPKPNLMIRIHRSDAAN